MNASAEDELPNDAVPTAPPAGVLPGDALANNALPNGALPLAGRRILVVEDEALVAMMIETMVEELGAVVAGSEGHRDAALAFIEAGTPLDAVVLDVNLGGDRSYEIARRLVERGIPTVFSTGYDEAAIPLEWRALPLLRKPFQLAELSEALVLALAGRAMAGG